MIKKSLVVLSISAAFFAQAQDVSTLRNSIDVYSNTLANGSAKFNAMSGSTGALGGDATALLNNPAGLGVAISSNIGGTLGFQSYNNNSSLGGSSIDYSKRNVDVANFNGTASFQLLTESQWKFVNLGVNYSNRNLDNYIETAGNKNIVIQKQLEDNNGNLLNGNLTYAGHAYDRTGSHSKMGIGIGANYANAIYFGAGLNFHTTNLEQYDSAKFHLDLDNSTDTYRKQYTPFSEQGSGFSASLGVIGKVNNQFRLGAALETPTWWGIERVYTDHYVDNSGYISYDNFTENRTFRSPLKATLSAAFVPNKNFALNIDYGIGLTKPKYKVEGPAETELNAFFADNSRAVSEVKVGAEYRIKAFRLRGGFSHASNPFDAVSLSSYNANGSVGNNSYSNLILGKRNTVGAGLGYDFKSMYIDLAFQNQNSEYSNPFLYGSVVNAGSGYTTGYYSANFDVTSANSVVSTVKNSTNLVSLTLGWKF